MRTPADELAETGLPAGLTPAQHEAVVAPDRVLSVLAGAGTGKTRVLTLRVARRVADDSAPAHHTLVTTFSRKAADELRRRLWSLGVEGVVAGTFHRSALALVGQHRLDRGAAPPAVLSDRRRTLDRVLEDAGFGAPGADRARRGPRLTPAQLDVEIGWAKARLVVPGDYEAEAAAHRRRTTVPTSTVAELYLRYEERKRRQRMLDFDDLLWSCADVLEGDPRFADAVRWRFRHLYVDEMQDVNPAQFRLLRLLCGDDPDLFVVGDPNQSVYGWNGADPTLLDSLETELPGCRCLRLDENHRCSPQVVAVAAAALGLGLGQTAAPTSGRGDGPVPTVVEHETDAEEARWVARQVWRSHRPGRRWGQIAVLARTNAQLSVVAVALEEAGIPVTMAGADLGPASDLRPGGPVDDLAGDRRAERPVDPDDALETPAGPVDGVVLATFHRAKGLQWSAVFVIGLSDGLVPIASARTPATRDEERRLLYVALTRAERELSCSWARSAPTPGRARAGGRRPSPWLDAVVETTVELRRRAAVPDTTTSRTRLAELRARLATT
ncbi:MAG TPA: ATP-dependent helicase [Acidimicrobiales bacterium]|nr:ATP-dependent helicase [Acidimicrobiales bacterium]